MFCKLYVCSLKINDLSNQLYGEKLLPYHKPPAKYTGELFGIQYLYQQSLPELPHTDELSNDADLEDEDEVDEGLGDESLIFPPLSFSEDISTFSSPMEDSEHNEVHCMSAHMYACMFVSLSVCGVCWRPLICVTCVIGFMWGR